jgi:hypothetical protein
MNRHKAMERLTGTPGSVSFKVNRSNHICIAEALALVDVVDAKLSQVLRRTAGLSVEAELGVSGVCSGCGSGAGAHSQGRDGGDDGGDLHIDDENNWYLVR